MHRIASSAKGHVLEKSQTSQTSAPPSGTVSKPPTQNALSGSAPISAAGRHDDLEKQLDAAVDPSPNSSSNDATNGLSTKLPESASPSEDTKETGEESTALASGGKPSLTTRAKAGSRRFITHTKEAIFHSWINVLLIFVPIGIAVNYAPLPKSSHATIIFAMNAVAIIPLAGLLSHATESVASRMGDTLASLLNVTFGNAVELIIFIIALANNEIRIVQASILGSILANLLLILGMAFAVGGLRYQEQVYNNTVTQMSACLLSLSVMSLLLPTAFHASFSNLNNADDKTLQISRGTSVVLLLVYGLYLLFQLKSHAYMYESTPQEIIDEESHPGVLADMMNGESSESSSSSSSSSSDSDSSSDAGSHPTATRRFKRAFRHKMPRRKSNASSNQATSVPSAVSSPSTELQGEGYFDASDGKRHDSYNANVINEDDAEINSEYRRGATRTRDFEVEQDDAVRSPEKSIKSKFKKRAKKYKKSKSKAKKRQSTSESNAPAPEPLQPVLNQVEFVEEPEEIPPNSSSRRPFAIRQISRPFRPPLPTVLTNNVFSNNPLPPPARGQQVGLSLARGPSTAPRRASSLPDRLSRPTATGRQRYAPNSAADSTQASGSARPNSEAATTKDDEGDAPMMSRTAAVMLLLCSTGLVAFCAELLVGAIPDMVDNTSVSQAFIGLIVLPIVGNAAEHVTAVTVAAKNKMDLAIGVAVGSSIQIALFITPVVILLGWIMNKDMSLYFNLFETVSLFVTAFVVNFLVLDGRSNYLEGSLLMAAYVIIAVCAFFYPNMAQQSALGGGSSY